jgi:hypothetical protein
MEIAVTAATTKTAPKGGSTTLILSRLKANQYSENAARTMLNQEIINDANLAAVQNTIENIKEPRNSIFSVQAELGILVPSLQNSTTLKPIDKNGLLNRANTLNTLVNDAISYDENFTRLEAEIKGLQQSKKATLNEIKKYQNEINSLVARFMNTHKQIANEWTAIYNIAPGSMQVKSFEALVPTPSEQAIPVRHSTRR